MDGTASLDDFIDAGLCPTTPDAAIARACGASCPSFGGPTECAGLFVVPGNDGASRVDCFYELDGGPLVGGARVSSLSFGGCVAGRGPDECPSPAYPPLDRHRDCGEQTACVDPAPQAGQFCDAQSNGCQPTLSENLAMLGCSTATSDVLLGSCGELTATELNVRTSWFDCFYDDGGVLVGSAQQQDIGCRHIAGTVSSCAYPFQPACPAAGP